jgi:hypothetical protein
MNLKTPFLLLFYCFCSTAFVSCNKTQEKSVRQAQRYLFLLVSDADFNLSRILCTLIPKYSKAQSALSNKDTVLQNVFEWYARRSPKQW